MSLRFQHSNITGRHGIDIYAEKQQSEAATDVYLALVLKKEQHLNIDYNIDPQMSLSYNRLFWYSNDC